MIDFNNAEQAEENGGAQQPLLGTGGFSEESIPVKIATAIIGAVLAVAFGYAIAYFLYLGLAHRNLRYLAGAEIPEDVFLISKNPAGLMLSGVVFFSMFIGLLVTFAATPVFELGHYDLYLKLHMVSTGSAATAVATGKAYDFTKDKCTVTP